jgi:hypothetical protein
VKGIVQATLPILRVYFEGKSTRIEREVYTQEIEHKQDPLLLEREHPVFGYWRGLTIMEAWDVDEKTIRFMPIVILDSESVDLEKWGWRLKPQPPKEVEQPRKEVKQ